LPDRRRMDTVNRLRWAMVVSQPAPDQDTGRIPARACVPSCQRSVAQGSQRRILVSDFPRYLGFQALTSEASSRFPSVSAQD